MPYRRLPKTDLARLSALQTLIEKGEKDGINEPVVSLRLQNDAKSLLPHYEQALFQYNEAKNKQKNNNGKTRNSVKMVRLYISHFIQVLNMSIARGEFKKNVKIYYELDPDTNNIPELTSEKSLLEWGEKIIKGESERQRNGGTPIFNPSIAKMQVFFEIFKDQQTEQMLVSKNIANHAVNVQKLRDRCDAVIFEVWNEVEAAFASLSWDERIENGKKYGLIYYFRRGENLENIAE
ncbi:MAG: hypothetical protein LBN27_10430 [Prevotellaceae bacterium]|jgi:hypothetical protein|nr:hypothetical protein [Prevotellaceae bacterium]